ncbi:MAG TPA: DUF4397 domain-containing protein [Leeuwenhoekiella sp.]|nr:DUF4397 domain-containing protein [Leeuwenhoekiella sp.]
MKLKLYKYVFMGFAVLALASCDENAIPETTESVPDTAVFVKFFFNVEEAPEANFYFDDIKISAVNSSTDDEEEGNDFGTVFPSNAYAITTSGSYNVNARDLDQNTIASTSTDVDAENNYSIYLLGTTEDYEVFVLQDELPPLDREKIYWRFVNVLANIPFTVDAYAIREAVPASGNNPAQPVQVISLGTGIDYKQAGDYTLLETGSYIFKAFDSTVDYDPETSEPYLQHTVNLSSKGRVYSTQIRGVYAETPSTSNIDFWRER